MYFCKLALAIFEELSITCVYSSLVNRQQMYKISAHLESPR